jgi:hypothetical protein
MYKILYTTIFSLIITFAMAEQKPLYSAEEYLAKSKRQRTTAQITLGCGAVSLLSGTILLANTKPGWENVNWSNALTGTGLVLVGVGCTTASLILFSSSKRNKRKAGKLNVWINKPIEVNTVFVKTYLPHTVGISWYIR